MQVSDLKNHLKNVSQTGWIPTYRSNSTGAVGHTLEYELGITENNLQIADFGNYELKAQNVRLETKTLTTLVHCEPMPTGTVKWLLENFGWAHESRIGELSFRQTVNINGTDRGFFVSVDDEGVKVNFQETAIAQNHWQWKSQILQKTYKYEISHWEHDTLRSKLQIKLKNTVHALAVSKTINGIEHFKYVDYVLYEGFDYDLFLQQIEQGNVYVDFDARTKHNHGTKFRIKPNCIGNLYKRQEQII